MAGIFSGSPEKIPGKGGGTHGLFWTGEDSRAAPSAPGAPDRPALCLESLEQVFDGCVDFSHRAVDLGGDPAKKLTLCYIGGMVRMERVSDYVLRPLAQDKALAVGNLAGAIGRIRDGALYNLSVEERTTMDEAVFDLIGGNCLLLFPGESVCLSFNTGTEEKRSVSEPENEPPLKGPRDSFVESIRTNTSLVRRRLRAPSLKIKELLVGRQTVTRWTSCGSRG